MKTRSFLLVPLLLAAACEREPDPPAASTGPVARACVSRPEGSRWSGEYARTAVFGDEPGEEMSSIKLAGIAVLDSVVYVMESQRAALWLLRPELSLVRRVGREGSGPGEWKPFGPTDQGGSMQWVHASPAGVRLFESDRIQEFDLGGRFRRVLVNGTMQAGLSPLQSRVAFLGDTLLYSAGGYDVLLSLLRGGKAAQAPAGQGTEKSLWWVRTRVGEEERSVLQLALVPIDPKQGTGPAQALPLWDANGRCIVASDGAEPMLVYALIGSGRQDTIDVPLPDRADRIEDYAERLRGLEPIGRPLAKPSVAARVKDLIIDPDGFVWLLPVQPRKSIASGLEVIRVPLGGGNAVLDTVPAFPRAFGAPGVYYAETVGPDDVMLVTGYALTSAGANVHR